MESIIKNIFQAMLVIGAVYSVGLVVFFALKKFFPLVEENTIINLNDEQRKAA
ncbi:hypothetical protein [Cloacibacillus evryensis]|uniref:hypothetical protein n=1 Tax=Cloacibacillus evryensis TaxID=508460 RepID=UPI00241F10AA|nr:hypothetical protein [Cloacibacillus evryensis]